MPRRLPCRCVAACAAALLATVAIAQPVKAPPSEIAFTLRDPGRMPTAPVAIRGISIDGRPLRLDRPLRVQGAWLHTIVITLANVSPKTIVSGGIGLVFPESGDGSHNHPYQAVWSTQGRVPKRIWLASDGYHLPPDWNSQKPWHFAPGHTVRLTFAADGDAVQARLADGAIHRAEFVWETFYFGDDSRWSAGMYALPPVPGSRQWTMVTPEQFRRSARAKP
ncbi:MAG TPA: hypothetical protein VFE06_19135 [Acidobacteriaceae bacterium]|jgi:hypothetical protein|nr:hypothetical protein [Acidobacteriaceae bacterium]